MNMITLSKDAFKLLEDRTDAVRSVIEGLAKLKAFQEQTDVAMMKHVEWAITFYEEYIEPEVFG